MYERSCCFKDFCYADLFLATFLFGTFFHLYSIFLKGIRLIKKWFSFVRKIIFQVIYINIFTLMYFLFFLDFNPKSGTCRPFFYFGEKISTVVLNYYNKLL